MNHLILTLLLSLPLGSFMIQPEAQPLRQGQDYAVFFAVNSYAHMGNLTKPIENATKIAEALKKDYGFKTEVVSNPTFDQIDKVLKRYKDSFANGTYPADGQLLIYFSGHGMKAGGNGYFMASDSKPDVPYRTAMEYDYFRNELIDKINCKHILVAIDACHSATFDPKFEFRNDRTFRRKGEEVFDRVLANHESYKARCFWTSDAVGKETPDKSSFAYHFLEGLGAHTSPKGYLRSSELFSVYLEKAAPKPGGGRFGSDDPNACFLFFPKVVQVDYSDLEADANAWELAESRGTIAAYQQYKDKFPNGDFVQAANQRISILKAKAEKEADYRDWQQAKRVNTREAYDTYLSQHPGGRFMAAAEAARGKVPPLKVTPAQTKTSTGDIGENISWKPPLEVIPAQTLDLPIPMAYIHGGTFEMGCTSEQQDCDSDEKPAHKVTLQDFYMGKYEVTFEEYDAFCAATGKQKPSDSGWGRGRRPVINVSWYDAVEYCNWLSKTNSLKPVYRIDKTRKDPNNKNSSDYLKWTVTANFEANGFRLPTEAEWEYAARQRGQQVLFGNGKNTLDPAEVNFYSKEDYKKPYSKVGTYRRKTVPVGSLQSPNILELHDMSGNVWEWCWDWKAGNYYEECNNRGVVRSPEGPDSGSARVLRGGGWNYSASYCRAAARVYEYPDNRYYFLGFRLSRTP